jgi:PEP-CTERM motif
MLNSLADASTSLLHAASNWDPAMWNAKPVPPNTPEILPPEPSTLMLALICLGILGVYASLQRWRRPTTTSNTASRGKQNVPERENRGAA